MDQDQDVAPSKTKRKKAMQDLQALGEELVELSQEQLNKVELPETLRDAVFQAKRITRHEARRRQCQYIGRLMREVDAANIRAHLDQIKGQSLQLTAYLHRLERWRERLIEDASSLETFAGEHPGCDIQRMRQLVRNARKEHLENKPPTAYRQLFQLLKEIIPAPNPTLTQPHSISDHE